MLFLVQNSWWKRWRNAIYIHDATASPFVAKVRGEILAYFHAVAVKRHSSMWNWKFGLPWWSLCEHSLWCQRKRWACSWLCSSPVSPFSISVNLDFPFTAQTFFPESMPNHCQGLLCIFPRFAQICLHISCRIHREIASGQTQNSK
jgi:hypothetical protein